jgi:hypothetical protein
VRVVGERGVYIVVMCARFVSFEKERRRVWGSASCGSGKKIFGGFGGQVGECEGD